MPAKMNVLFILAVNIPLILGLNDQCTSTALEQPYYTAAVVEYAPENKAGSLTQEELLWRNVENYEQIILDAAKHEVDIIVFPEYGLTSLSFPRPLFQRIGDVGENPCSEPKGVSSQAIQHLSCAARAAHAYVVIDVTEVVPSDPETSTRDLFYNTAVAFDRNGTIVAKYHKTHLFGEDSLDAPEIPEVVSFTTDFGVEFGMFICFDMQFLEPSQGLLGKGIRHFVYPTAWIDELPYLTAVQAQMYWSSSTQSVLLASGYHSPSAGSLGSGIFASGVPLNYTFDPSSGTKLLLAQVPKDFPTDSPSSAVPSSSGSARSKPQQDNHWYYEEDLSNYTAQTLSSTSLGEEQVSVCDNGFCCSLNYSYSPSSIISSSGGHKLIVFNQTRKFSSPSVTRTMQIQVCSVVRCHNDSIQSCSHAITTTSPSPTSSSKTSNTLNIVSLVGGPFTAYQHRQPGFSALDTTLDLVSVDLFTLNWDGRMYSVTTSAQAKSYDAQTVAIFNRVF